MNDNREPYYYEDVIDLRELVKTLLDYKWIIVGVTLLAALAAFLVSTFYLPPQYQASSFVTLTEPIIRAELDPSIQVSPNLPDTEGLAELAEADAMIRVVSKDLGLKVEDLRSFEWQASMQGQSQLKLQVTAPTADFAAEAANRWAELMVSHLNDLYGTGDQTLETLEREVKLAKEEWTTAQTALEDYLPQSRVDVLEVRLAERKDMLSDTLTRIEYNQDLVRDIQTLKAQVDNLKSEQDLSTGKALSIIALQQRASGGISGAQFQIQGGEILGAEYTLEEGMEELDGLLSAILNQNREIQEELTAIEESILNFSQELESERFAVEQLKEERDLARTAYTALANQLEETKITQAQEEHSAKVGVEAVVPHTYVNPNEWLNMALAGLIGFFVTIGFVLIHDWWEDENH
mgnify:CR=1 FL=1